MQQPMNTQPCRKARQLSRRMVYAEAAAAFLGVDAFFGAAFLVTVFLTVGDFALVLVTRPDLVFARTLGTSTTAGA